MTFAAIETAINAATTGALANATATWGAYTAAGIYAREYSDDLGIGNRQPTFMALASALPGIAQGAIVSIAYQSATLAHTVRGIEPDGTGMIRLILERA